MPEMATINSLFVLVFIGWFNLVIPPYGYIVIFIGFSPVILAVI